MQAKVLARELF